MRFNGEDPAGLIDRKAPGATPKLAADWRRALAEIVEKGPVPAVHGGVRWRLIDHLVQGVWEEFRVSVSTRTPSRELRARGYRKLSARPRHHAQEGETLEQVKRTSPPRGRRSPKARRVASG